MTATDIGEDIKFLRKIRDRFLTDTPVEAYDNSVAMVDRLWPIRSGQLDQSRFHLRLYQPDPKAPDHDAEQKRRRDSAILAKLAMPRWGYSDNSGKPNQLLIDELDYDLQLMAKDGIEPYERYIEGRTEPAFSTETARYNQSLLPKQREQLFEVGLHLEPSKPKRTGRKRTNSQTDNRIVRTAPLVRGREHWRPKEILEACHVLHRVATWISEQSENEPTVVKYAERYRLSDLSSTESKYAPTTYPARLAIAIATADHTENGTDDYVANDQLASAVSYFYGIFLQKRQRRAA